MKSIKYIIAISLFVLLGTSHARACGPYYPEDPGLIRMFRCCSPRLERQWQDGCRFQDFEREQNCRLWQDITSADIPLDHIDKIIYSARLSDIRDLSCGELAHNKFAQWLSNPEHKEDLEYVVIAKEIEQLRNYMNDPWYYGYDGDDEHKKLGELSQKCKSYTGNRHAARYALQLARIYFAARNFKNCVNLWENHVQNMPQDIVTDMIASYAGGAYSRLGNRAKAIELFTRSQDIGSLISLKAWDEAETKSAYTDPTVKELEYIFNRFPDSPLLSIKLQLCVSCKESDVYYAIENGKDTADDSVSEADRIFNSELKRFALNAVNSPKCSQKGMWNYALGYIYYLDGNMNLAKAYLSKAESSEVSPVLKEWMHAFRFLIDAKSADSSASYRQKLMSDLEWLDARMEADMNLDYDSEWQYSNRLNWPLYYWQDVARKVLLGEVCPRLEKSGDVTLALQLANYASNRIYQLSPYYKAWSVDDSSQEAYIEVLPFEQYRRNWSGRNNFDYSSQFFEEICSVKADDAAKYAENIINPKTKFDEFLNNRGYVDADYINEIVGTLYLREMKYDKAVSWLSKVSSDYQNRTNIAKDGYFDLDPFRYQVDNKQLITDSKDYKLRFAKEMSRLESVFKTDTDPNRRAEAKMRYAIGLRNSFGRCWYLTAYLQNCDYEINDDYTIAKWYYSESRECFKKYVYANNAYKKVDALTQEALNEFTDPEMASRALFEMKNYATLMKKYPQTFAAAYVKLRCDNYYDYAIQKR